MMSTRNTTLKGAQELIIYIYIYISLEVGMGLGTIFKKIKIKKIFNSYFDQQLYKQK